MSTAFHAEVPKAARLVTPELALIDPVLAATERERLPDPDDTLSRSISVRVAPLSLHTTVGTAPFKVDPVVIQANVTARRLAGDDWRRAARLRRRRRAPTTARLAAVAVIASLAVAVLLDDRTGGPELAVAPATIVEEPLSTSAADAGPPGSASTMAGRKAPRSAHSPRQRTRESTAGTAQQRRFAWAPVAQASGYRVEFYRRSERVFSASTTRAQIVIPASWESGGRVRRLEPGDYRWYVWSIVDGKRAPTAIVQASLIVS